MSTAKAIPYAPTLEAVATKPASLPRVQYDSAIGYLRAFVTLLVLAHHSVLAYHPFAPPPQASLSAEPRLWPAFPIVDSHRWSGFSMLVGFNDAFFMSLMFFLSGLFVWNSLQRKGAGSFVRDRLLRLGVPFLVAAALLAPLAYYPAYLQTGGSGWLGFWRQWFSLGNWPPGRILRAASASLRRSLYSHGTRVHSLSLEHVRSIYVSNGAHIALPAVFH